jgi:hypothetical protein
METGCHAPEQQTPYTVPPMIPASPPTMPPMTTFAEVVIIPSPVFVGPRVEPINAPVAAPPTKPRTTLFVTLPPLRRFTSRRLTSDNPTDCTPFDPRNVMVSGDTVRSFPLTRKSGRAVTLRRMDSPVLNEAICWQTVASNGARKSAMNKAILTEIFFVGAPQRGSRCE